jgi:hypothetical protein
MLITHQIDPSHIYEQLGRSKKFLSMKAHELEMFRMCQAAAEHNLRLLGIQRTCWWNSLLDPGS